MAEGMVANQQNNGVNGGLTPPPYLQYRTPTGPGQGGPTRPVITPPAMTGTGLNAGTPQQGGANTAMVPAPQPLPGPSSQPYLDGPAPNAAKSTNSQTTLGKLIAGV